MGHSGPHECVVDMDIFLFVEVARWQLPRETVMNFPEWIIHPPTKSTVSTVRTTQTPDRFFGDAANSNSLTRRLVEFIQIDKYPKIQSKSSRHASSDFLEKNGSSKSCGMDVIGTSFKPK